MPAWPIVGAAVALVAACVAASHLVLRRAVARKVRQLRLAGEVGDALYK